MRSPELRTNTCGALGLLVLAIGCASPPAPGHDEAAGKPAAGQPAAGQPATPEPPLRALTLPAANPTGPDRQVHVVLDAPHLKIVSIALRRGTPLPEHTAPVPVVIQADAGSGHAIVGDQRVRLDATHAVTLAPNVPHAVEPDAGTDMTLLVFHLRGGSP